jgi:hypothetical protein
MFLTKELDTSISPLTKWMGENLDVNKIEDIVYKSNERLECIHSLSRSSLVGVNFPKVGLACIYYSIYLAHQKYGSNLDKKWLLNFTTLNEMFQFYHLDYYWNKVNQLKNPSVDLLFPVLVEDGYRKKMKEEDLKHNLRRIRAIHKADIEDLELLLLSTKDTFEKIKLFSTQSKLKLSPYSMYTSAISSCGVRMILDKTIITSHTTLKSKPLTYDYLKKQILLSLAYDYIESILILFPRQKTFINIKLEELSKDFCSLRNSFQNFILDSYLSIDFENEREDVYVEI